MKRFLVPAVPIVLVVLAACNQAPVPEVGAGLEPLAVDSPFYEAAQGLAGHSTGVYVVGVTGGSLYGTYGGGGDAFISKYSTSGVLIWGKQYGTPTLDLGEDVAADRGGNAYAVGSTSGSLTGLRSNSSNDAYVRKYSPDGAVLWTRQFGTATNDVAEGVAVYRADAVYVVGEMGGYPNQGDAFLRKYTASGSLVWTRPFGTEGEDAAADVALDRSGNVYVVGSTTGSLGAPNGGSDDIFLRKYTPDGNVVWDRQMHLSSGDYAAAVTVSGGHLYLVGGFYYNAAASADLDVRVVKYTTSGSLVWSKGFGPASDDLAHDVAADSSGVTFVGRTEGSFGGPHQGGTDGFVYKLGPDGATLWRKQQGTAEGGSIYNFDATFAVLARTSGELYTAGTTYGWGGAVFLTRLNGLDGSTVWTD